MHENTTNNIKQLGFSGLRGFRFPIQLFHGGQRRAPKTQPFHIVIRYRQLVQEDENPFIKKYL